MLADHDVAPLGDLKLGFLNRGMIAPVVGIIVAVVLPVAAVWWLNRNPQLDVWEAAGIVGSVGTLILLGIGGIFAIYQFRLFRHHEPHLNVAQTVSHHQVSPSYVAISITVHLRNNSRVVVRIREALFRIQRFSGFEDVAIETMFRHAFVFRSHSVIEWPTLQEVRRFWDPGEIAIEPGGIHSESYEFIVANDVQTVMVYSSFYNPETPRGEDERRAWHATSVYSLDIGADETS